MENLTDSGSNSSVDFGGATDAASAGGNAMAESAHNLTGESSSSLEASPSFGSAHAAPDEPKSEFTKEWC